MHGEGGVKTEKVPEIMYACFFFKFISQFLFYFLNKITHTQLLLYERRNRYDGLQLMS